MIFQTIVLSLLTLIGACYRPETRQPTASAPISIVNHEPLVQILTQAGLLTFEVEIAKTAREREKGLMNRDALPQNKGMIFLFEEENIHTFWMKNTFIPLDLIFFDKNWFVVGLIENMKPLSADSRSIGRASQYVLEVNAGLIKKEGIRIGDTGVLIQEQRK